jgi:hypothetical protein
VDYGEGTETPASIETAVGADLSDADSWRSKKAFTLGSGSHFKRDGDERQTARPSHFWPRKCWPSLAWAEKPTAMTG